MSEGIIGLEVVRLDEYDPRAPWQMTVDAWVDDGDGPQIVRYQVRGKFYDKHERTLEEIARVQGDYKRRDEIAEKFDALDRAAGAKIAEIVRQLQRDQIEVVYGQEGLDLLDCEERQ
jgi:hypothetical protein